MKRSTCQHRLFMVVVIVLLLVTGFPTAALAQTRSVRSAATCVKIYTARDGDTLEKIARRFLVNWQELARYNSVSLDYPVIAGDQFCIPGPDARYSPALAYNLRVWAGSARLYVTVGGFKQNNRFEVRVTPAEPAVQSWSNLGSIRLPANTRQTFTFELPSNLRQLKTLSVCLKDKATSELFCRTITNFPSP